MYLREEDDCYCTKCAMGLNELALFPYKSRKRTSSTKFVFFCTVTVVF